VTYRSVSLAFNIFLERLTPLASQRTAAAMHRVGIEASLKNAVGGYMFESGSFSHGTGVRNYSDVDAFFVISLVKPGTSDTALNWVKSGLQATYPGTAVRISRPAVVVPFAGGTETWEIIPGFMTSRGSSGVYVYDIPGPVSGWIDSAPSQHLNYVTEINNKDGIKGGAKSLARLAKAWKRYNSVPISSFYLEMRAAQHMAGESSFISYWDICRLLEKLQDQQLGAMNDPKKATGRFHACSSDSKRDEALSKLNIAAVRARRALDATNVGGQDGEAFKYYDLLFGGKFPSHYYS